MIDKDRELHCKIQVGEFFLCKMHLLLSNTSTVKDKKSNLKQLSEPLDINKMMI